MKGYSILLHFVIFPSARGWKKLCKKPRKRERSDLSASRKNLNRVVTLSHMIKRHGIGVILDVFKSHQDSSPGGDFNHVLNMLRSIRRFISSVLGPKFRWPCHSLDICAILFRNLEWILWVKTEPIPLTLFRFFSQSHRTRSLNK